MASTGNIGSAIYDILTNDIDVSNIYGNRVGPTNNLVDSTTYPRIVYTLTDIEPSNTKGSDGESTLDVVKVKLALFNLNYSELIDGQKYVREALDYINSGDYPSSGSNIIDLQSCSFTEMNQEFIEEFGENGIYVAYLDFQFRQKRSITSPDTIMIFDTRIQGGGSTPTNQLKLYFAGSDNDCVVDWGDGSTTIIPNDAELTHTYTSPGIKKVTFSGNRVQIKYDASISGTSAGRRDAYKLLEIKNWGIFRINSDSMFEGCKNMTITATDIPSITATNFTNMFAWCFNMTAPSTMNNWDVSDVVSFQSCFYFCLKFDTYINDWDVSNSTNFQSMFNQASIYNQDLNNWDVSNGRNFNYMFYVANLFNGDITTWQFTTTNDISMVYMLAGRNFNRDISNWNTERVTTMQQMIYNNHQFNQNLNSWNLSNCTNVYRMLYGLDFYDQPMDNWDVSNITDFRDFMRNSDGYSTANYDALLISWSAQDVSLNESINFGSSQYTAGGDAEAARNFLITNKGWSITDGGAA